MAGCWPVSLRRMLRMLPVLGLDHRPQPSQLFYKSFTPSLQLASPVGVSVMLRMKRRRAIQIATIVSALSLLTSYVMYSQRQQVQSVASSSKFRMLNSPGERAPVQKTPVTNTLPTRSRTVVAPGSKSLAPLLSIPPAISSPTSNASLKQAPSQRVFPGSKSAPVFDLKSPGQDGKPKSIAPALTATNGLSGLSAQRATNSTAITKSSP